MQYKIKPLSISKLKRTIFVTCIGSIGKVGITLTDECAFNQQINAVIPNEKVLPKYLAYNFLFNKTRLTDLANTSVVPIINKTKFEKICINIEMDKNKQKYIISVLDKIVDVIKLREKELRKLDELIKARLNKIAARWPAKAVAQFYFY